MRDHAVAEGITINGLPSAPDLEKAWSFAEAAALDVQRAKGERSVERPAQLTGLTVANASQHLQHLRRCGFVQSRRDGKHVLYHLGNGPILELLSALRCLAERNSAEVRGIVGDYLGGLDELEAVSREELLGRPQDGSVTLLDVRPEDEFALGHLPGALNVPLSDLERRLFPVGNLYIKRRSRIRLGEACSEPQAWLTAGMETLELRPACFPCGTRVFCSKEAFRAPGLQASVDGGFPQLAA